MPFPSSSFVRSGRFSAARLIGHGAGGQVYYALDNLGRAVAVKEVLPSARYFQDLCDKLQKEAQIQAALQHPNIVHVYHLEQEPDTGERYLICEYVPGGSLADHLKTHGPLAQAEAIEVALAICHALEAIAEQRIVHRDIKPSNILLVKDQHGRITSAKLGDFGIAQDKRLPATTQLPGMIHHPGTPEYMAPEQADITQPVDVRTDLYALGISIWEMLTGKDYKLLAGQGTHPALAAHSQLASPGLDAIIGHAVQADRLQRYPTPQAMAYELAEVRDGTWKPTRSTMPFGAWIGPAQRRARPQLLIRLATIVIVALALAILSFWLFGRSTRSGTQTPDTPAQPASGGRPTPAEPAAQGTAAGHQQQRELPQVAAITVGPPAQAPTYSPDLARSMAQTARWNAGNRLRQVTFSPDGHTLATTLEGGIIQLWGTDGGQPLRTLCPAVGTDSSVLSAAFAPDGQSLTTVSGDGVLQSWRVSDGALLRTLDIPMQEVVSLAFAPNGETLAASVNRGTMVQLFRTADGGLERTLVRNAAGALNLAFALNGKLLALGLAAGDIIVLRVNNGEVIFSSSSGLPKGAPPDLTFAPDGQTLAAGLSDGTVQVWHLSGQPLRTLGQPAPLPTATMTVLSLPTAIPSYPLPLPTVAIDQPDIVATPVYPIFAPDGRSLAVALSDGSVQLWQLSDGALLRTLTGVPGREPARLAFAPEGKLLTIARESGIIELWGAR